MADVPLGVPSPTVRLLISRSLLWTTLQAMAKEQSAAYSATFDMQLLPVSLGCGVCASFCDPSTVIRRLTRFGATVLHLASFARKRVTARNWS
jgi:hypothetical protein